MKDILNREINLGDLVLAYQGSDYFSAAKYCIVIGSNRVYNGEESFTTSRCIKIGALTSEQESIKEQLMSTIQAHNLERAIQNTVKLEPVPGGVYMGDSNQYVYLYLGRYRVDTSHREKYPQGAWKESYGVGGYCYLKLPTSNQSASFFLKTYLNKNMTEADFRHFFANYTNIYQFLRTETGYGYYRNTQEWSLSNFVVSTKRRTFKKELGKVNINNLGNLIRITPNDMAHNYYSRYCVGSYLDLIPLN